MEKVEQLFAKAKRHGEEHISLVDKIVFNGVPLANNAFVRERIVNDGTPNEKWVKLPQHSMLQDEDDERDDLSEEKKKHAKTIQSAQDEIYLLEQQCLEHGKESKCMSEKLHSLEQDNKDLRNENYHLSTEVSYWKKSDTHLVKVSELIHEYKDVYNDETSVDDIADTDDDTGESVISENNQTEDVKTETFISENKNVSSKYDGSHKCRQNIEKCASQQKPTHGLGPNSSRMRLRTKPRGIIPVQGFPNKRKEKSPSTVTTKLGDHSKEVKDLKLKIRSLEKKLGQETAYNKSKRIALESENKMLRKLYDKQNARDAGSPNISNVSGNTKQGDTSLDKHRVVHIAVSNIGMKKDMTSSHCKDVQRENDELVASPDRITKLEQELKLELKRAYEKTKQGKHDALEKKDLLNRLAQLQYRVGSVEYMLEQKKQELNDANTVIEENKTKHNKLTFELEETKCRLKRSMEIHTNAAHDTKNQQKSTNATLVELKKEIKYLSQENTRVNEACQHHKLNYERLSKRFDEVLAERDKLAVQIDNHNEACQNVRRSFEHSIKELKMVNKKYEDQIQSLLLEEKTYKDKLEEKDRAFKAEFSTKESLRRNTNSINKENVSMRTENGDLKAELFQVRKELETLNISYNIISQSDNELKVEQKQNQALKERLHESYEKFSMMKQQIVALQRQIAHFEKEAKELKRYKEESDLKCEKYRQQESEHEIKMGKAYDMLKVRYDDVLLQNKVLQEANQENSTKLQNAFQRIEDLKDKISELEQKSKCSYSETERLRDKLKTLQSLTQEHDSALLETVKVSRADLERYKSEAEKVGTLNAQLQKELSIAEDVIKQQEEKRVNEVKELQMVFQQQMNEMKNEQSKHVKVITALKIENDRYLNETANKLEDKSKLTSETDHLKTNVQYHLEIIKELRSKLLTAEKLQIDTNRELDQIKHKSKREKDTHLREIEVLRRQGDEYKHKMETLKTEVAYARADLEIYKTDAEKIGVLNAQLQKELNTAEDAIKQQEEKRVNEVKELQMVFQQQMNEMKNEQSKHVKVITALKMENDRYLNETANKLDKSKLTSEIDHLKTHVQHNLGINEELRRKLENAEKLQQDTDRELDQIKHKSKRETDTHLREMEVLRRQEDEYKQKMETLETEVAHFKTKVHQHSDSEQDMQAMKKELEHANGLLLSAAKEIDHSKSETQQEREKHRMESEKLHQLENRIGELNSEVDYLKQKCQEHLNSKQKCQNLRKELEKANVQLQAAIKEHDYVKEEANRTNKKSMREAEHLRLQQKAAYESKLEQIKYELNQKTDVTKRNYDVTRQLENANKELAALSREMDRNKSRIAEADKHVKEMEAAHNKERERHDNEIKTLNLEILSLKKKSKGTTETEQGDNELKRKLEKANYDLKEAMRELDDTKTRLSKLMGQKLTDNNPNIADLSDKNRPTKLAERFTELYDNQWTDAFEIIDTGNEQETIDTLIKILNAAMEFCRKQSETQMGNLRSAIMMSSDAVVGVPDLLNKQLKDCRKVAVEESGKHLFQKYVAKLRTSQSSSAHVALNVQHFLKECFEICWLMNIQDPPVVLGPELKHGDSFNTDIYKAYTTSGPAVDYVVWPALYLYQGGAILCKGVAQGYGNRKK